ncbi:MAG: hypothetical protein KJ697_00445 [Nanoarchaeota archaeon]|nr:hypothetical protein [Nanoarchaeota archaeon]MBU4124184.1 hypothetical protein [Nanoarchaeota archaeon]
MIMKLIEPKWLKPIFCVVEILIAIVSLLLLTVFALRPTDTAMLTNALLSILILILIQMLIVNILLGTHMKGGRKK